MKVLILGAGEDAVTLLELFLRGSRVKVIGIADENENAPGVRLAHKYGIRIFTDPVAMLVQHPADFIINVSANPAMGALILKHKQPHAEVLGGAIALLLWELTSQYERELREQLIQAEKLATVETLASGIAHEINNPLYIITGFAEHLRDETRPEVIAEYLDAITDSAQRIARIIRDVTAFTRRTPPEGCNEININQILDKALALARRETPSEGVTVISEYESLPAVLGKQDELIQTFLNIITNALQAMEGGGILTISTADQGNYVQAIIKDTGPGIPRKNLNKIFDPFFTTKEPRKGTGLGLHLVRELTTLYGGYVSVESTLGHGAAFIVRLPAVYPAKEETLGVAQAPMTT